MEKYNYPSELFSYDFLVFLNQGEEKKRDLQGVFFEAFLCLLLLSFPSLLSPRDS